MWSKRLMRTVMAGMAVLVYYTGVAAQECSRPPAKIAVLMDLRPRNLTEVNLLCDKAKTPACSVTFWCTSYPYYTHSTQSYSPRNFDPVTWDVSVEPGTVFRYRAIQGNNQAPGTLQDALLNAGLTINEAGLVRTCVVRSNDPVEVIATVWHPGYTFARIVSQRISPPEPYPCLSSNAALSGLTVSGGGTLSPSFDSDTTAYTFTTRATKVTFTPTAADSGATIRVNNAAVQSGTASGSFGVPWSRLPITVTAEDGTTTRTYYVTTTRFGP